MPDQHSANRTACKIQNRLCRREETQVMRLCLRRLITALLLAAPAAGFAASCTTQSELKPDDRSTLASLGERLSDAVLRQDTSALQTVLRMAMTGQWDGIRGAVEQAAPLVKGGKVQLRNLYLLDATMLTAPGDTQFFCSNTSGS